MESRHGSGELLREAPDGPPEHPLEPSMTFGRLELEIDGSPLESEKRPIQFGREGSIV